MLRQHIAALYLDLPTSSVNAREIGNGIAELSRDNKMLFQEIVQLKLGKSLLICPTAAIAASGARIRKIEEGYVKFKTRQRVTVDEGKSRLTAKAQF
jgi:hypothetical protein